MTYPQTHLYAAVRRSADGHEWIDVDTFSGGDNIARTKAHESAKHIKTWAEANPVVRVQRFRLTEDNA